MAVSVAELSANANSIVDTVARSRRPALVLRDGKPVAALVPVSEEDLEDFILSYHPDFVEGRRQADQELREGKTQSLEAFLAELEAEEQDQA